MSAWRRYWIDSKRWPDIPTIRVGNAVLGGAGKTPTVMTLAGLPALAGKALHILMRGYGSRLRGPLRVCPHDHRFDDVGDEALLHARYHPTWIARDRPAGAWAALRSGAEILLLDDGAQNPSIRADFDLLVVDGKQGFGNGHILPAGPLREPIDHSMNRADAILLIGEASPKLRTYLDQASPPLLTGQLSLRSDSTDWLGQSVIAFAGIGQPEKFFTSLQEAGAHLLARYTFPDHHRYCRRECEALYREATDQQAILVTTSKDRVRLPPDIPIHVLEVDLILNESDWMNRLIETALQGFYV